MEWLPLVLGGTSMWRYFFSGTPIGDPACYLYGDHDLAGFVNARKIKTMLHEDKRFRHIRVSVNPPGWEKITMKNCWEVREQSANQLAPTPPKRGGCLIREDFNMNAQIPGSGSDSSHVLCAENLTTE